MIPKIIHQTSHTVSWEEKHLMHRAKRMMPDFEFKFWTADENFQLFSEIFPHYVDEYKAFKQGVIRIDIIRCLYLYRYGGIYCDTDYKFLRPLDDDFLSHKCVLGVEELNNKATGGGTKVGNAFMALEKGFSLWLDFVESIFQRSRQGEDRILYLGGPHALSIFIRENEKYKDDITVMPQNVVYPDFKKFKITTIRDDNTLGAHLCWGSWRGKSMIQNIKSRGRRILSAIAR